jgi:hypothetical protein
MEINKIVEKALKGEDYSADVKDMTPEDKTKVSLAIRDAADVAAKKELERVSGLRKAGDEIEKKKEQENKDSEFLVKFAGEQLQKAKSEFFSNSDYPLSDAEKAKMEAEFKTDKTTPEQMLLDLEKFYVAMNSKKFIEAQKKVSAGEKEAAKFMASQAGGGTGGGNPDDPKYTTAAKKLFALWQSQGMKKRTLDDAQKLVDRGVDWHVRKLSK